MSFEKPTGTRGARMPTAVAPMIKWVNGLIADRIARTGKAFGTMPALVLCTVGRKSGAQRRTPLAYIPDGDGAWLIVAAYAGAATNPAWYHNLAARPESVTVELEGVSRQVTATELHGSDRERAWRKITSADKRFAKYQEMTDRELPVIRLTLRRP